MFANEPQLCASNTPLSQSGLPNTKTVDSRIIVPTIWLVGTAEQQEQLFPKDDTKKHLQVLSDQRHTTSHLPFPPSHGDLASRFLSLELGYYGNLATRIVNLASGGLRRKVWGGRAAGFQEQSLCLGLSSFGRRLKANLTGH
jgi:hypothetical protein